MPDTLALWTQTRSARITRIDFQAVPARSSGDVSFRVCNQSSQYTARNVTLAVDEVTPGAAGQLLLSRDGHNFAATISLGDLSATAVSPVVWLRRTTPSDAATGAAQCRVHAHAESWVPETFTV